MHKKKVIAICAVVIAGAIVAGGTAGYVHHKNQPRKEAIPDSTALSAEETENLLKGIFENMDKADITVTSSVRWGTPTANAEAGTDTTTETGEDNSTEAENTDTNSDVAVQSEASAEDTAVTTAENGEDTAAQAPVETNNVTSEMSLSANVKYSGKNMHSQWTKAVTDGDMNDENIQKTEESGELYISEKEDGSIVAYAKSNDDTWVQGTEAEGHISGADYMKSFLAENMDKITADHLQDESYIVHAAMLYADAVKISEYSTNNTVSIADADLEDYNTNVEILIDKDKNVKSLLLVTENENKVDKNADGKVAEQNNVSITFNQSDVVEEDTQSSVSAEAETPETDPIEADLLSSEKETAIVGEIQAKEAEKQAAEEAAKAEAERQAAEQAEKQEEEEKKAANADNESSSNNSSSSNSGNSGSSNKGNSGSNGGSGKKNNGSSGGNSSGNNGSSSNKNYVYGQNTDDGWVDSSQNIPYESSTPTYEKPSIDPSKGDGSWESNGKPDYADKEFAGYVPDDYTEGHE